VLQNVIDLLYYGLIEIPSNTVQPFLALASYLDLPPQVTQCYPQFFFCIYSFIEQKVIECCCKFLRESLGPENVIERLAWAQAHTEGIGNAEWRKLYVVIVDFLIFLCLVKTIHTHILYINIEQPRVLRSSLSCK